ncbi:MAG: hypothetical protein IBX55_01470 [Methyloprofundus sp.]|nr:hypothetical protein [Methyloprofundus sp.]
MKWLKRQTNERVLQKASETLDGVLPYVVAKRLKDVDNIDAFLAADSFDFADPFKMKDFSKGVDRLFEALERNEHITISCDYDADGLGAASILKKGLNLIGFRLTNLEIIVSERYNGGYGFNKAVCDKIIENPNSSLVITVDQGSSDHVQIERLISSRSDVDIIVTDHHHVPEITPDKALAFINPNREDDRYPHKDICGAIVALLLISAVIDKIDPTIDRSKLFDIGAISTIGDMMPLDSLVNRFIVKSSLARMKHNPSPFWRVIMENYPINEETVGFYLGPRINAFSRMGVDPSIVIEFLTTDVRVKAQKIWDKMTEVNDQRKELNKSLKKDAELSLSTGGYDQKNSISVFLEDGASGLTGIVASNLKESTGKPSICFCPKHGDPDMITGSGRSVSGIDIRKCVMEAIEGLEDANGGGHPAACGLTIKRADFNLFSELFEKSVNEKMAANNIGKLEPVIEFDAVFNQFVSLEFVHSINKLAPFGMGFEKPIFAYKGYIDQVGFMGEDSKHARFVLDKGDQRLNCVLFNHQEMLDFDLKALHNGQEIYVIGDLNINKFRGEENLQIMVKALKAI